MIHELSEGTYRIPKQYRAIVYGNEVHVYPRKTLKLQEGEYHRNCDRCVSKDKCDLLHSMLKPLHDFYCVVPLHIAKRIGIKYNPLYQQGSVGVQCREYRNGDDPF